MRLAYCVNAPRRYNVYNIGVVCHYVIVNPGLVLPSGRQGGTIADRQRGGRHIALQGVGMVASPAQPPVRPKLGRRSDKNDRHLAIQGQGAPRQVQPASRTRHIIRDIACGINCDGSCHSGHAAIAQDQPVPSTAVVNGQIPGGAPNRAASDDEGRVITGEAIMADKAVANATYRAAVDDRQSDC